MMLGCVREAGLEAALLLTEIIAALTRPWKDSPQAQPYGPPAPYQSLCAVRVRLER